jgi:OmpA-OmpF porin, OOP family
MLHNRRSQHVISLIISTAFVLFSNTSYAYSGQLTYAGAQLGGSSMDYSANSLNLAGGSSGNGSGIAWHVFAGYQMNTNFAVETGFIEYGDMTIKNIGGNSNAKASISQRSVDVMGKLTYPLNSLFDVYLKAGVAYVANDTSLNSAAKATGAHLSNSHSLAITYALGTSYAFYPNAKLDFTWQRVASEGGVKASDFAGVGVTLYFS